jgi:hypothetical protein
VVSISAGVKSGGEAAIAAGLFLRRGFEHDHFGALLLRRQRRAKRRIAGADDDYICGWCRHS